jgi:hypothetical protein
MLSCGSRGSAHALLFSAHFLPLLDCATEEGNDLQSGDKNLQQRLETLVSWLRGLWDQSRSAAADPSTHHPQTEKRLGPCSLRMTAHLGKLGTVKCRRSFDSPPPD